MVFSSQPAKQSLKKKNVRKCQEENKMVVEREREADGDYLSFFGMQNDFFVNSFELIQV